MKKILIVILISLAIFSSCSQFDVKVPSEKTTQQQPIDNTLKTIEDLSSYSYIGVGAISENAKAPGNGKMKMLGIKKHTGEASVVHFVNKNGEVIQQDPYITASLICDSFSFYKISFESSSYYNEDFESATGDIYCLSNENGSIYKLEEVVSINAGFGEYDCYNGIFIGSLKFASGETKLCKIYIQDNELKVEKKVDLEDFPEFKHVFMDANFNIFAYDTTYLNNFCHFNWVFPTSYVLSNTNQIYSIPSGAFLAYNRVVYCPTNYRLLDGVPDLNNPVLTFKESLKNYAWNETKGKLEYLDLKWKKYETSTRPDGKTQYISKDNGDVLVDYYNDLDLANVPTSEFLPPELTNQHWNSAHHGPFKNWGYSTLLSQTGDEYIYLTKLYDTGNFLNEHYVTKVTFTNTDHTKYTMEETQCDLNSYYDIIGNFVFTDKHIFFLTDSTLRVLDYETLGTTTLSNTEIVKYHSIEKINNNKIAFVGTNNLSEKVYYEIDSSFGIKKIGTTPTFSSVNFKPITVAF